jgi:hypothetical protein
MGRNIPTQARRDSAKRYYLSPEVKERKSIMNKQRLLTARENGFEEYGTARYKIATVCDLLKKHHEQLKDDPERLTCDFMKKVIGIGKEC